MTPEVASWLQDILTAVYGADVRFAMYNLFKYLCGTHEGTKLIELTEEEYNALEVPIAGAIYFITDKNSIIFNGNVYGGSAKPAISMVGGFGSFENRVINNDNIITGHTEIVEV